MKRGLVLSCVLVFGVLSLSGCSSDQPAPPAFGPVREIQVGTWRFDVPPDTFYGSGELSNDYAVQYFAKEVRFTPPLHLNPAERDWSVTVACKQYPNRPPDADAQKSALVEVESMLRKYPAERWDVYPDGDRWVAERSVASMGGRRTRLIFLARGRSVLVIFVSYGSKEPTAVVERIVHSAREVGEWQDQGQ